MVSHIQEHNIFPHVNYPNLVADNLLEGFVEYTGYEVKSWSVGLCQESVGRQSP